MSICDDNSLKMQWCHDSDMVMPSLGSWPGSLPCTAVVTFAHHTKLLETHLQINSAVRHSSLPMLTSLRGFVVRSEAIKLYRSFLRVAQQAPADARGDAACSCTNIRWAYACVHERGRRMTVSLQPLRRDV